MISSLQNTLLLSSFLLINIVGIHGLSLTKPKSTTSPSNIKTFHFGGGCFWAPDDNLKNVPGIISSSVGYCGDDETTFNSIPTYDKVCGGRTNLVEAVRVEYDTTKLSFTDMLDLFAQVNTAEWANKRQYKGIIFTSDDEERKMAMEYLKDDKNGSVVAEVEPMSRVFYTAEKYHQNYWSKWRIRGVSLLGLLGLVGTYGEDFLGDDVGRKVYNAIIWAGVLFSLVERRFFYGQEAIEVE